MLFLLQLVLYCLLYILLVKCAVRDSGLHCLYFYPKEYIEEAHRRGIADKAAVMKSGKRFMISFCIIIFAAPILMISFWQSTRRTNKALAISLSRSVIWPPILIALLPLFFGREILWLCHSFSEGLTAVLAAAMLTARESRTKSGASGLQPGTDVHPLE